MPPVAAVLARLGGLDVRPGWVPPPPGGGDPPEVAVAVGLPTGDRDLDDLPAVSSQAATTTSGRTGPGPTARVVGEHVPPSWRRGRFDPGRRGAAALGVLALVAGLLAAVVVLRSRPHEVVAPTVVATGRPVPGSSAEASPAGALLVVAVDGKVAHPGLVRLPAGSRVDDGIRAAGGVLPGTDLVGLNLARKLVDGEQVVVGAPPPPPGQVSGSSGAQVGGLLDLNAATVTDLDGLPGIGPVLAQHIVDWRTEHGRFGSVDQLREVGGIGESKYAQLKGKVRV